MYEKLTYENNKSHALKTVLPMNEDGISPVAAFFSFSGIFPSRSVLNKARDRQNFYANLLHVLNTFVASAAAVVVAVVVGTTCFQYSLIILLLHKSKVG